MPAKKSNKKALAIPDTWALCGLYALLLLLFVVPGVIIDGQPISALQLMQASELYQYSGFPGSIAAAREIITIPILSAIGLILTLVFRTGSGKYAFSASLSLMMFALIGVYAARHLDNVGGFVVGAAMCACAALFFVSIICAVVRR